MLVVGTSKQAKGAGGIALIQGTNEDAGTTTSATLAFKTNNTAGNWIGVCIRAGLQNEAFTVTDAKGNTYHKAFQFNQTGGTLGIFYAENIAGGANTIRVSDTASATLRFEILEYSGVVTSGSLDVTAIAQGNGSSASSGTATTTVNGDLVLGAITTSGATSFTAGSGYRIEESVPAEPYTKLIAEDRIQTSAGATSASASLGMALNWAAGLAAFKAVRKITASPATVNFGNVSIGSSSSQTVTLANSGRANVTISNIVISGACISVSGVHVGLVLTPGQTATLTVTFAPAVSGSVSGGVTVTSNATNSSLWIAVSGTGFQPAHSVYLRWNVVTGVVGYNVYRGSVSGGPYAILTTAPVLATSFTDTTVQSGHTYYYVATSVDSNGAQSNFSNLATITIP